MRTRQGLEPNLSLSEIVKPARGMFDMGAATARGVTRGTLGLPGDLESIVRMLTGGEQVLPTSNDWHKKLPPLYPDKPAVKSPYDELGMYYSLPVYGNALSAGNKGIKKLGGAIVGGDTNVGRREFAKKAGALAVGSTALAKAMKYLDEVAPLTKQADEAAPAVKETTEAVAKGASKHKFNSLKEYNDYLNQNSYSQYGSRHFQPEVKRQLAKEDEALYYEAKDIGGPEYESILKQFSPQAKKEMKEFKTNAYNLEADRGLLDPNFNPFDYLDDYLK